MQSIAETCVRFDAAHLSINLVSEIALPMFPTLNTSLSMHKMVGRHEYFLSSIVWTSNSPIGMCDISLMACVCLIITM